MKGIRYKTWDEERNGKLYFCMKTRKWYFYFLCVKYFINIIMAMVKNNGSKKKE